MRQSDDQYLDSLRKRYARAIPRSIYDRDRLHLTDETLFPRLT